MIENIFKTLNHLVKLIYIIIGMVMILKNQDTDLSKLKNASTVFDLNNIDKFNFGIFKLSNYFENVLGIEYPKH